MIINYNQIMVNKYDHPFLSVQLERFTFYPIILMV